MVNILGARERLDLLTSQAESFLQQHAAGESARIRARVPLSGKYSLYRGRSEADLYGMIDAVYIVYTLGRLIDRTDLDSRRVWASRILACQDEDGWFSRRNLRRHAKEHATAYAIGALTLLQVEPGEDYLSQIRPVKALEHLLQSPMATTRWLARLGFEISWRDPAGHLGWHYVWRGSHIGGGLAAVYGMVRHLVSEWWPDLRSEGDWLGRYFDWLDAHINPQSGYWQRAFWNHLYCRPTLIDMGGAVHFLWIYAAAGRPFPYPEATLRSTLALQRETGLYGDHPFCIDLDGVFCMIRSFLQFPAEQQAKHRSQVSRSVERSFEGILTTLLARPLDEIYVDTHGLPGALAALTECSRLPDFRYFSCLKGWQHVLDRVWWL